MKHIAIDCRLWNQGGVGRYIRNLVWELLATDKENSYTLLCRPEDRVKVNGARIVKTNATWHSFSEQMSFWKELEKESFDLVHFPYFSHPILYNRPFVVTIHDLTILHHHTGKATTQNYTLYLLKRFGYRLTLNHAVKKSAHIIVPTEYVKKDVIKTYGIKGNKMTVTYEGVGTDFASAREEKVELPFKDFFVYVGNFYPHKNVDLLLEVCKKVPEMNLVCAGPNDFFARRIKNEVEERGLSEQIYFAHGMSDSQLKFLYRKSLGLILPSFFEGFGLPVVEAAYCRAPLLLSEIPAFTEIAPRYAQFFSPRNSDECAALVRRSLSKRKVVMPELTYFKRFSFSQLASQTRKVYNSYT